MKKIILGLAIAAFTAGNVFAAESEVRHELDNQKKQAKMEYEKQREELKSRYQGDELEQKLQKAESDYKAKAKQLDQKKKVGEDPGDVINNGR